MFEVPALLVAVAVPLASPPLPPAAAGPLLLPLPPLPPLAIEKDVRQRRSWR